MPKQKPELEVLLKALEDLRDFLPHLVLVGGWVPFLYTRYLWRSDQEPLLTFDIDFGFREGRYKGTETIADRVQKHHWGEHHVRLGHDVPFVPVVKTEKGLKAEVEFIAGPALSRTYQERLVGHGIRVNTIEDFDLLLDKTISIGVGDLKVRVPEPPLFVFHKLLTFLSRQGLQKRKKDLYYAYYVLLVSPEKERLEKDVRELIRSHPAGPRVRTNIESFFEHPHAEGPASIAQASIGSSIPTLVSDIPEDSYRRITALIAESDDDGPSAARRSDE